MTDSEVSPRRFPLLPWASAAILAVVAAAVAESWSVERARNRLLQDEGGLAAAALQATQNQLEAERILTAREKALAAAASAANPGLTVVILTPPPDAPPTHPTPLGVMVWDASGRQGILRVSDLPAGGPGNLLALWMVSPDGSQTSCCGVFPAAVGEEPAPIRLERSSPVWPGSRYLLFRGWTGLGDTLEGARATGSIILATPPPPKAVSPR